MLTLDYVKEFLRIDHNEEDGYISVLTSALAKPTPIPMRGGTGKNTDLVDPTLTKPHRRKRRGLLMALMRTETRCFNELFKAKTQNNISPSYGHD